MCGSTLCGTHDGQIHGVTLGCVDGDPGVEIEMHIFVGSRAHWDHIGGDAPQDVDGSIVGWKSALVILYDIKYIAMTKEKSAKKDDRGR